MFYYKYKNKYLCSFENTYRYDKIDSIPNNLNELYFLYKMDRKKSKRSYALSNGSDLYNKEESLDILKLKDSGGDVPEEMLNIIGRRRVKAVNTDYDNYEECFSMKENTKKTINILALGDVGSTLLTGLRLLGRNSVKSVGIFDRNSNKIKRWEYEMNQVSFPFDFSSMPQIHGIEKEHLFDCDMFVFCASKEVPPVGNENVDVRMVQFEENSKLVREYAHMAAKRKFKGIFAVVSDPVDLLCKEVLKEGRGGLVPEQIKGYGLGVMNARAAYYAKKYKRYSSYLTEGRAYGPHGKGLVIANSIVDYDDCISRELTRLTVKANLEVRRTGFKPYVAPALSSGAISIICTIEGKWHYSSNYIGGAFMGVKNRNLPSGLEIEKLHMPEELFDRIEKTYEELLKLSR